MYSSLTKYMRDYKEKLEGSIRVHCREIGKLPEGQLGCFRNRKYFTWYRLTQEKNNVTRTLVPKSNRKLAEQLALRGYYEDMLRIEKRQLRAVDLFIKYFDDHMPGERYLNASTEHLNLLNSFVTDNWYSKVQLEWMNRERLVNQPREEELQVSTILGYKVRSKSESDYVTAFANHKIVFRYEWPLYLSSSDKTIFPDFTAKHPITEETIYIEHFGMIDDQEYVNRAALKIGEYVREGILPGRNLFFSYESRDNKFSSMDAEEMVRKLFVEV